MVLQAHKNGVVLKSASFNGTIMTRCMIRKEFFFKEEYSIEIRNQDHEDDGNDGGSGLGPPLIEFCLPFAELKAVVDGICDEGNTLELEYPVGDSFLELRIPEESEKSAAGEKLHHTTTVQLESYNAQHDLNSEFYFDQSGITVQIFGKVLHFKKALKEFNFMGDKDLIEVRVSQQYPHLQFKYVNPRRAHVIKFNAEIEDLVYKRLSETSAVYYAESLRFAFSRV